ncbi:MAG: hypothetical protein ACO1Q7_11225 [Gemmatimonas sp.]
MCRRTLHQRTLAVTAVCFVASVAVTNNAALAQRVMPPVGAGAAATTASSAPADRADVSGKWAMILSGPQGANEALVILRQEAESISGSIDSQLLGAAKITGTIRGDTLRFLVVVDFQSKPYEVRGSAALRDKDNIAGSLEPSNGVGTFPFTMRRVPVGGGRSGNSQNGEFSIQSKNESEGSRVEK